MEDEGVNKKVLVIDDEPFLVDIMRESLSMIGFRVSEAYSGSDALRIVAENELDMLITDLSLPDIDGLDVIRKAKELNPDLICIGVTGHVRDYRYIDVITAGAVDFIKKPFDIEELQAKSLRALNEKRQMEELRRLSQTDPLTGILNRRTFFHRLRDEIKRADRQRSRVTVMMLDLDGFKEINDKKGHLEGDRILIEAARIMRSKVREGMDLVARYGGDEFAIMIVDAPERIVERIASRIREDIWSSLSCGVSIGSAIYTQGLSAEELVGLADKKLLMDKERKYTRKLLKVVNAS